MPTPLCRARMRCQATWYTRPAAPLARKAATRKVKTPAGMCAPRAGSPPVPGGPLGALPAPVPRERLAARVPRRTVDGRNLPAHGPDVGAELAAVMDGVEEDEPQEFPDRALPDHLAAREEHAA